MALVDTPPTQGGGFTSALRMGTNGDRHAYMLTNLAFDNSYLTGGEPIPATFATYFPGGIQAMFIQPTATYEFSYDSAAKTIQAWVRATGAQVANGVDLSALTAVPCLIFGRK